MQRLMTASALAVLLASPLAGATVLWHGDFETGNLAQWTIAQAQTASRLQIETTPVRQGHYALRAQVDYGDYTHSGCRAELAHSATIETEGNDRWYSWSTMFPWSYPSDPGWQVFTQWHHSGPNGSPPLELDVIGEHIQVHSASNGANVLWMAPLVRGKWHDFVMHVRWSSDPSRGLVELYYDGQHVLRRSWQTLYPGQYNYLKQGLYRKATIVPTGVVYHDAFTSGTTMASVAPALAASLGYSTSALSDAQAGDQGGVDPVGPAPEATTQWTEDERADTTDTSAMEEVAAAQMGCSSTGGGASAALGLAVLALALFRRRRTA